MRFYSLIFPLLSSLFLSTVSQALPTNATRMATEAYVTNRVAIGVASAVAQAGTNASSSVTVHNTNTTAHASLFTGKLDVSHTNDPAAHAALLAGKVDRTDTNGWVVSTHSGLATTNQLNGYFPLSGGRLNSGASITVGVNAEYIGWIFTDYNNRSIVYGGGNTPTVTLGFPDWEAGESQMIATREWVGLQSFLTSGSLSSYLPLTGGTVTGPISYTNSTAPADNDLARAGWVRSLFNSGHYFYVSTNTTTSGYGGENFLYQTTIPPASTRTYTAVTNNQYVGMCWTPVSITNAQSPILISAYLSKSSGGTMVVKPEIYFTADKTNTAYEADITTTVSLTTTPTLYQWVVPFPDQDGAFYVGRRFKIVSQTTNPNFIVSIGTNSPSAISINAQDGGAVMNPSLTGQHVTNIVRSITFTNQTWGAVGTNATYRMTWDITNMTFKVEEILP